MKTLQLVFDKSDLQLEDELKDLPEQEITFRVIRNIILNYAGVKRGLLEDERRIFYKICGAFEKAVKFGDNGRAASDVQLDDSWVAFIKKCKKEPLVPGKLLQRVEELIDGIKDR